MIRVILQDISPKCEYQSSLECYPSTGEYLLSYFSLHNINPTLNILVSLLSNIMYIRSSIVYKVAHVHELLYRASIHYVFTFEE